MALYFTYSRKQGEHLGCNGLAHNETAITERLTRNLSLIKLPQNTHTHGKLLSLYIHLYIPIKNSWAIL